LPLSSDTFQAGPLTPQTASKRYFINICEQQEVIHAGKVYLLYVIASYTDFLNVCREQQRQTIKDVEHIKEECFILSKLLFIDLVFKIQSKVNSKNIYKNISKQLFATAHCTNRSF